MLYPHVQLVIALVSMVHSTKFCLIYMCSIFAENLSFAYSIILFMEARGAMVKVMGNGLVTPSSNPGCGNCISLSANTLGKGMNPTLPPAMDK